MASREIKGHYEVYKQSTNDFVQWLSQVSGVKLLKKSVQQILDAAGKLESRIKMPAHVALGLATAIRLRKEVAQLYRVNDKGDAGHDYCIFVLRKCQQLLAPDATVEQKEPMSADDEVRNRFESLEVAEDFESSLDDISEEIVFPDPPACVSAADLLGQTQSFAAACFLVDFEDLMRHVERVWDKYKQEGTQASLLAATAITNTCVLNAESIIATMELLHPLLHSLEHIVTAAYLSEVIAEIQAHIRLNCHPLLCTVSLYDDYE